MNGQSPAAAGASAETNTPQQQQPTQSNEPQQQQPPPAAPAAPPPRLGAILAGLELPADVIQSVAGNQPEPPTPAAGSEPQPGAPNEPAQPANAQTPSGSQGQQPQPPEQNPEGWDTWPESARAQVMEERRKRKERTEALERATAELQDFKRRQAQPPAQPANAQTQPQQPQTQVPAGPPIVANPGSPLAEVENKIQEQVNLLAWANHNARDGAYDVVTGKNPDGSDKREDFAPERIANLQTAAQVKLSELQSQRTAMVREAEAGYVQIFNQAEEDTRRDYPDLFNEQSELHRTALEILAAMPEIRRFGDWKYYLGTVAKAHLDRTSKVAAAPNGNGNGNGQQPQPPAGLSPTVAAFLKPQPKIPPTPPVTRGAAPSDSSDVDVTKAREKVIASGGDDTAMEQFIAATRRSQSGNRPGGREAALV